MEKIVLHLKLTKEVRVVLLAYVIWCHIKVAYIFPGHDAYLNLDEEMIVRALIVDRESNLKLTQNVLYRAYLNYQCDTFKVNNAIMYQTIYKIFMDMDAYVYMKQNKTLQDG